MKLADGVSCTLDKVPFVVIALLVICALSILKLHKATTACLDAVELRSVSDEKIIEYNNEVILYNQNIKKTNERALQQEKLQQF